MSVLAPDDVGALALLPAQASAEGAAVGTGSQLLYMASALLFILGIKRLSKVKSARSGNWLASLGMLLAVATTLVLLWGEVGVVILVGGLVVGGAIGLALALRVPLTSMPELVAFYNGMGGAASMFVALAQVALFASALGETGAPLSEEVASSHGPVGGGPFAVAVVLSILIGGVTLSGSLVAYGKLAGKVKGSRLGPIGGQAVNALLALVALLLCWYAGFGAESGWSILSLQLLLTVVALVLGVGLVFPIGGADMPVVISLLNSYSGLAASATGFVLQNNLLIVAGSLVGAAGLILTSIMCKAMNRSLANVMFARFGEEQKDESGYTGVKQTSAEEVAPLLDAAQSLIIVPGYGLAVAQAQHKARELADLLQDRGCDVKYAIHPVAGRMPGHMNVLLAEADVPYEQLFELDQINAEFKNTDIVIVVGANDVCNPAANTDPASPIAGMPVLEVWEARTVVVIKRSLSAGYAGIKNELFEADNTLMLFADAKQALEQLVSETQDL